MMGMILYLMMKLMNCSVSCADLQKMKEDIKYLNESIDKNVNNKGSKTKLNPIIIKKENNPNFIGNKTIFGNLNKKK